MGRLTNSSVNIFFVVAIASCTASSGQVVSRADTCWTQAEIGKGYVVFRHSTLEILLPGHKPYQNERPPEGVGPEYKPNRQAITDSIHCALARGEYKSVQIGIYALEDLENVHLELDLDLEFRIYHGIDFETQKLLRGYQNPVWPHIHAACLDESKKISRIEKGTTAFFWVTLHASLTAAPGKHLGKIRIHPEGRMFSKLDLQVNVRPFELQRARIAYAPFYYVDWGPTTGPPKFAQSDGWIEAIFRDMAEHSHNSVIGLGYGLPGAEIDFSTIPPKDNRTFSFLLPLAQKVGLASPDIPVFHFSHNLKRLPDNKSGMSLEQQNEALAWYETERRRRGWPELIAYGQDEPGYPNPALRQQFAPIREVRMRLGTAMFAPAVFGLGDLHDIWIVRGGEITAEMCAEARRLGAEVWTYLCDAMSNRPLYERHFAGLYVWAYRLKGHSTWHYYAQEKVNHPRLEGEGL